MEVSLPRIYEHIEKAGSLEFYLITGITATLMTSPATASSEGQP